MKATKNIFFIVVMIAIFLLVSADSNTSDNSTEEYNSVSEKGITFEWKVNDEFLDVRLRGKHTGYLAVGFNPEVMMKGADLIIGYVKDGDVFIRDDYGNGMTSHIPDEEQGGVDNISKAAGSEVDGLTTIEFRIPLDSGDDHDTVLRPGEETTVLLAASNNDDFSSYHSVRVSMKLEL